MSTSASMPNIYWTLKTEETEETEEFLSKKCDFRKHYNGSSLEKRRPNTWRAVFQVPFSTIIIGMVFNITAQNGKCRKQATTIQLSAWLSIEPKKAFVSLKVGYVERLCEADKALSSRDNGFRCLKEIHSNFKMQSELPYWSEPNGHFSSHFSIVCK